MLVSGCVAFRLRFRSGHVRAELSVHQISAFVLSMAPPCGYFPLHHVYVALSFSSNIDCFVLEVGSGVNVMCDNLSACWMCFHVSELVIFVRFWSLSASAHYIIYKRFL